MSRRNPGTGGLSFVQANAGRVERYTFSPEVERARRNIEREFPRIQVLWDHETHEHLIVQTDVLGHEQTLLFATRMFVEDVIRARLHAMDNSKRDVLADIDKTNEEVERDIDRRMTDRIHEAGEKLAHAFAQDGLTVRPRISFSDTPLRAFNTSRKRNFEAPSRPARLIRNR